MQCLSYAKQSCAAGPSVADLTCLALRHTQHAHGIFPVVPAGSSGADLMPELFVVDPCFKEQFQLPNATPEYSALWQDLPNLFVGTAEQLVPVVELLCTQVSLE